jgi:hypothetical protein
LDTVFFDEPFLTRFILLFKTLFFYSGILYPLSALC